jgi:SulP family sulfate permease
MAGVLVLGILKGVIFASVASIILLIRAVSMPHLAVLGRIPGTRRYSDVERHPDNEIIPGLLIIRLEASLLYFNIENVYQAILDEIAISGKALRVIVWDFSTSPYVDIAGARLIKKLYRDLAPRGISLKIAEAHAMVRDMLRAEGIEHLLGHISRKVSVDDLVKASFPDYRIN